MNDEDGQLRNQRPAENCGHELRYGLRSWVKFFRVDVRRLRNGSFNIHQLFHKQLLAPNNGGISGAATDERQRKHDRQIKKFH
jgi:hypothetical protein